MRNSKAIGPDSMATIHLKHFGPKALQLLSNVIAHSFSTGRMPMVWKTANVTPLQKPNKPAENPDSYRPVSILSPVARLAERLLLTEVKDSTNLPQQQHGFRTGHSTVTAVSTLTEDIIHGFNSKRPPIRTVAVALDLKKAFDTVNIDQLIKLILESNLSANTKKWLANYLRGRTQSTLMNDVKSKPCRLKTGVPQGSVLSPILFAWYMEDIPQPTNGCKLVIYADDITVYAQNRDSAVASQLINEYLAILSEYLESKQLIISVNKCSAMLFSTWNREWKKDLHIVMNGTKIPETDNLTLLGVHLDHSLTFGEHANKINAAALKKNNALKLIANHKNGLKRKEATVIYKAITKSTLNYAAAAWAPNLSETNWKRLETRQNDALRTTTGCVRMSPVDHLRLETKCLPIRENCKMIATQFAIAARNNHHPCHKTIHREPADRYIKKTLLEHLKEEEVRITIPEDSNNKTVHSLYVHRVIDRMESNKVLNDFPPVNPDKLFKLEKNLTREQEVRICQLRSGYSPKLNGYLHRIGGATDPECRKCRRESETVRHMMSCYLNRPPEDLWNSPGEIAKLTDDLQQTKGL